VITQLLTALDTLLYIYVIMGSTSQLCQKCQCIEIAAFHRSVL